MAQKVKTAITPTREEDYPEWYQQVVRASDMAERSPVRGCMVIKPWGYALWENIQREMDDMFKATGVKNAYFPLFIPLELSGERGRTCRRFRQRVRRGDPPSSREGCRGRIGARRPLNRTAGRAPYFGDHHRRRLLQVGE